MESGFRDGRLHVATGKVDKYPLLYIIITLSIWTGLYRSILMCWRIRILLEELNRSIRKVPWTGPWLASVSVYLYSVPGTCNRICIYSVYHVHVFISWINIQGLLCRRTVQADPFIKFCIIVILVITSDATRTALETTEAQWKPLGNLPEDFPLPRVS